MIVYIHVFDVKRKTKQNALDLVTSSHQMPNVALMMFYGQSEKLSPSIKHTKQPARCKYYISVGGL